MSEKNENFVEEFWKYVNFLKRSKKRQNFCETTFENSSNSSGKDMICVKMPQKNEFKKNIAVKRRIVKNTNFMKGYQEEHKFWQRMLEKNGNFIKISLKKYKFLLSISEKMQISS